MRIVLLGAPGSGKGTQAKVLADHYRIRHIGVGDVLRQAVRDNTPIGQQIAETLASGDLVTDEIVFGVIWPLVVESAAAGGYILDGFPRTLRQAEIAYDAAQREDVTANAVVYLHAERGVLLERMMERAAGRADDVASVMNHRLEVFEERTHPLVEFYGSRDILVQVDAEQPVGRVSEQIIAALDAKVSG